MGIVILKCRDGRWYADRYPSEKDVERGAPAQSVFFPPIERAEAIERAGAWAFADDFRLEEL